MPPNSERGQGRVLSQYLFQPHLSVKEVIDQLERDERFSRELCVMAAVAKEKEPKRIKPRFFWKLPYPVRLWQTTTEANIARGVFPYIPTQIMTLSDLDLLQRISDVNRSFVDSLDAPVFITVDFVRWCLKMQLLAVTPTFRELDRLFGLSAHTRIRSSIPCRVWFLSKIGFPLQRRLGTNWSRRAR